MIPPPPRNTRTYTLFPDTTLFRYAAVTAIIALHEHPKVRAWFGARGDGAARRLGRELLSLLLTGFVVEIALAPIALYHFHRSGVYGALANIVAIPLTTLVVMPAEALALVFEAAGLGGPLDRKGGVWGKGG